MKGKNLVSAITLSGSLTIAHYLMVLRPLLKLEKKQNLFLFLADLHATTTGHDPQKMKILTKETASYLFACGFKEATIFVQSQIKGLSKFCFLLGSYVNIGTLKRMTQFKTKIKQEKEQLLGLLNYPLLMASDILLYDADVFVGNDQKQHVELTRDLGDKINKTVYHPLFHLPKIWTTPFYQYRIRDLKIPTEKMSKSSLREKAIIFLSDKPSVIRAKISKAQTDSENKIFIDFQKKPGLSNLILLYALAKDYSNLQEAEQFLIAHCQNYLELKEKVADALINLLQPLQAKAFAFQQDFTPLKKLLEAGRKKAQAQIDQKFIAINHYLGFYH